MGTNVITPPNSDTYLRDKSPVLKNLTKRTNPPEHITDYGDGSPYQVPLPHKKLVIYPNINEFE